MVHINMRNDIALTLALALMALMALIGCSKDDIGNGNGTPQPKVQAYAEQGWTQADRDRFYHHDQGSRLIPFSIFENIELADSSELFRSDANLASYQYLLDAKDNVFNPYGLPVGFTVSDPDASGMRWLGMTCAACHTGEIHYKDTILRIDGAPAMAHFQNFMDGLTVAINAASESNSGKYQRLITRALGKNPDPGKLKTFDKALAETNKRLTTLAKASHTNNVNKGGYGTLDAFGEIVNAVTGSEHGINVASNIKPPQNPTSYPFLWNGPFLEKVQWNGVGTDVMSRNLGEVLGVFGQFVLDPTSPEFLSTSANIEHLFELEEWLKTLKAPKWNEALLGKIDTDLIVKHRAWKLYEHYCETCHVERDAKGNFPMTKPNSYDKSFIQVNMTSLPKIGTDPKMATDFVQRITELGMLQPVLSKVLNKKLPSSLPTALVLGVVVGEFKKKAYKELGLTQEKIDAYNGYHEDYNGSEEELLKSLLAYKAGPLEGIWATAPYLHNDSVLNLWELLKKPKDRLGKFYVGNREFDPINVGFKNESLEDGYEFDTTLRGNSNVGHNFGTRLSDDQKKALIEYIKTLCPPRRLGS